MRTLRLAALVTVGLWALLLTVRSDLLDDVAGVFNTIISIPGDVVRAIYNAIRGVFDFFGRLTDLLGSAWDWMVNGIEWLGSRAGWLAESAWSSLSWAIGTWAPHLAQWAWWKASHYALGLAHDVEQLAKGLVSDAIRFLQGAIRTVEGWARTAFGAVWGEIKKAADWIAQATVYVFGILAHPARLAAWVVDYLVVPLAKFVISNSAPVIRWLARGFLSFAPDIVHTLEDALASIL